MAYSVDLNWNTVKAIFQIAKQCTEKTTNGVANVRRSLQNLNDQLQGGQGETIKRLINDVHSALKKSEEINQSIQKFLNDKLAEIGALATDSGKFASVTDELSRLDKKLKGLKV